MVWSMNSIFFLSSSIPSAFPSFLKALFLIAYSLQL
nr:MAG TPA: hypothetical protein [Caudoviricetes sp.]